MNTKIALLLTIVLISTQSCTIFSLNPLYHEEDLLNANELTGVWIDIEEGDEYASFENYDGKKFVFRYIEEHKGSDDVDTISFEAGLLKVGDHFFIDLYPYYDANLEEADYLFRGFIPILSTRSSGKKMI